MKLKEFQSKMEQLGPSRIIPFVGSGFVVNLGYPTWKELLLQAAEFVSKHSGSLGNLIRQRTGKEDFLGAGDLLEESEVPKADFYSLLRNIFDKHPDLNTVHERLARCAFPAFVTTNFDKTIEQALTKVGKTPESIAEDQRFSRFNSRLSVFTESVAASGEGDQKSASPLRQNSGLVLKMHGDITAPELIVMGNRQLRKLASDDAFNFLYRRLLSSYTLVFLGFSGKDPVLQWHCENVIRICGTPTTSSFLLLPETETPPLWIKDTHITVVPFSSTNGYSELGEIVKDFSARFERQKSILITSDESETSLNRLHTLAMVSFGLKEQAHSSAYQLAVDSMVAEAGQKCGSLDDNSKLVDHIARTYHLPVSEAQALIQQADRLHTKQLLGSFTSAKTFLDDEFEVLARGLTARCRAIGRDYTKKGLAHEIVLGVLVKALSVYGNALSLSLLDIDMPESTVIDRVIRTTINELSIPGIGSFDKEVLRTSFADLFIHPSKEEGHALVLLAQAALAHSLAATFSGGLRKVETFLPSEAYLDANVSIPLVAKDHPRSSYYHELVARLLRSGCDVQILDVFLNEMESHCRLAYEELELASVRLGKEAKAYAEFHGPLWINAFVSAYASGGGPEETFASYLVRAFGSDKPKEADFRRVLADLGVRVVDTSSFDATPGTILAIHIASEKKKLTWSKPQKLADHEALQIMYLHQDSTANPWFITEDAALRKILRKLSKTTFSPLSPARGVMPAQGAFMLVSSLAERPSLHGTFSQFLWNPVYIEMVDSMLASLLRKMPAELKKLKERGFAEMRELIVKQMQTEMERSENNVMHRRAKEFKSGRPEMLKSILSLIGEKEA